MARQPGRRLAELPVTTKWAFLGLLIAGAVVALFGGLLLRSSSSSRQITYEPGEVQTAAAHTSTAHGLSTTDEVALLGNQAGVALLQPGDPQWNETLGFRAEWHGVDHIPLGVERWHGINYYLPDDWHQGTNEETFNARIVFQFHTSGGPGWSPLFGILVTGDESSPSWAFYRKDQYLKSDETIGYRNEVLWKETASVREWVNFTIHVVWTADESGFIELYRDRILVYSEYGIRTMNDEEATTGPYSKWGIYGQPTRIIFDDVRIAEGPDQLDVVAP